MQREMFWSQHVASPLLLTLEYLELILGLLPFQGSLQNNLLAHFATAQLSPYKSDQNNPFVYFVLLTGLLQKF